MASRRSLREKLALHRAAIATPATSDAGADAVPSASSVANVVSTTASASSPPSVPATEVAPSSEEDVEVVEDPWLKMLAECARVGHVQQLKKLLASAKCPSQESLDAAFFVAAEHGHTEVLAMLSARLSSLERVNHRGEPAVVMSARCGHTDAVELLLRLGSDMEARDANGDTPLLAAVEHSREATVRWLLQHKADVDAADDDHNSVLHVAAFQGVPSTVLMVLQAGACTNVLNDEDETPLEIAKNSDIARILLEFCAGAAVTLWPSQPPSSSSPPSSIVVEGAVVPSPFQELVPGPVSYVFWSALGVSVDNHLFQQFGVFPFDRLNDTERIVILTEVAEGISGYRTDLQPDVLRESALYAVFAMMKSRAKKEIESCESNDHTFESSFSWRKRILEAYEHVYACNAGEAGLTVECNKRTVWNTVINLIARTMFHDCFWEKKRMFLTPIAAERPSIVRAWKLPPSYFSPRLPTSAALSQSAVQLTFKKLMTMSKNFLSEELMEPSGCFCQDCIAEREVPLTFKLQFLEESADEKRKKKGRRQRDRRLITPSPEDELALRLQRDDLILHHRQELSNFWSSISTEEKWALTEMSTSELSETISQSVHWEVLRAALQSYAKYAWEEDLLEISDDCVTIADDMCESNGMEELLVAMLDAVMHADAHGESHYMEMALPKRCSGVCHAGGSAVIPASAKGKAGICADSQLHEDEWDRRGRQMLENLCLCEFARKVSAQYLLKKEESRAQRVALELELELLQEEEQQMRAAEKKAKRKKKKKKKGRLAVKKEREEGSVAETPDASVVGQVAETTQVIVSPGTERDGSPAVVTASATAVEPLTAATCEDEVATASTTSAAGTASTDPAPASKSTHRSEDSPARSNDDELVQAILAMEETEMSPGASQATSGSAVAVKSHGSNDQRSSTSSSSSSRRKGSKAKRVAERERSGVDNSTRVSAPAASPASTGSSRRQRHQRSAANVVPASLTKQPEYLSGDFDSGFLYACGGKAFQQCMALRMFSLPKHHQRTMQNSQKCALFMFNQETRRLHGVFEPLRMGGENMNPLTCAKSSRSGAASVRFSYCDGYSSSFPLPESSFKRFLSDGICTRTLSSAEVLALVEIWRRQSQHKHVPTPQQQQAPRQQQQQKAPRPAGQPPRPSSHRSYQLTRRTPKVPTPQILIRPQVLQNPVRQQQLKQQHAQSQANAQAQASAHVQAQTQTQARVQAQAQAHVQAQVQNQAQAQAPPSQSQAQAQGPPSQAQAQAQTVFRVPRNVPGRAGPLSPMNAIVRADARRKQVLVPSTVSGNSSPRPEAILRSTSVPLPPSMPAPPPLQSSLVPGVGIWAPSQGPPQHPTLAAPSSYRRSTPPAQPPQHKPPHPSRAVPPPKPASAASMPWSPSRSLPTSRSPSPTLRKPPHRSAAPAASLANLTLFGEWDGIWQISRSEQASRPWSSGTAPAAPTPHLSVPSSRPWMATGSPPGVWAPPQSAAAAAAAAASLPSPAGSVRPPSW